MEFMMGHKTDLSGTYAGLADFDDLAIGRLKEKYVKGLQHLEMELNETAVKCKVDRLEEQVEALTEMNQRLTRAESIFELLTGSGLVEKLERIRRLEEEVESKARRLGIDT